MSLQPTLPELRAAFCRAQFALDTIRRTAQNHLAAKFLDGETRMSADDEVLAEIIRCASGTEEKR